MLLRLQDWDTFFLEIRVTCANYSLLLTGNHGVGIAPASALADSPDAFNRFTDEEGNALH